MTSYMLLQHEAAVANLLEVHCRSALFFLTASASLSFPSHHAVLADAAFSVQLHGAASSWLHDAAGSELHDAANSVLHDPACCDNSSVYVRAGTCCNACCLCCAAEQCWHQEMACSKILKLQFVQQLVVLMPLWLPGVCRSLCTIKRPVKQSMKTLC